MIRHVVTFQLAAVDSALRAAHAHELKDRLESLRDVNDEIMALDVFFDLGKIPMHWPLILVADFATSQSLNNYLADARHRSVIEWSNDGIVSGRAVIDFELPSRVIP